MASRSSAIVHASLVNIAGNAVLSAFKMAIGLISGSIAITIDAVNNLSDAMTSVVAIVGTKLAGRKANDKHPFGYGRMEYIASIAIASIIIAAGITSFLESVQAIFNPPKPDYRPIMLVIVGVACVAKIFMGLYLRRVGCRVQSDALMGSGIEAMMDSIVSAATILAAIVHMIFDVNVEAWLGTGISLLIGKAGIELLFVTVSKLLGERVDAKVVSQVEATACEIDGVKLASGTVLQDFGPERLHGSLYVTVDGSMPVAKFDELAREVQQRVSQQCCVKLTSVGVYPLGSDNPNEREVRARIGRIVWMHDDVVELRGLIASADTKTVRFDAIADFSRRELNALQSELVAECEKALLGWSAEVRVLPDV